MVLLGINVPEERRMRTVLFSESILTDARSDPYTWAEIPCDLLTGWLPRIVIKRIRYWMSLDCNDLGDVD